MRRIRSAVIGGLILSLTIETAQLTYGRSTDVDDLILNTLGALIGGVVAVLLAAMSGSAEGSGSRAASECNLT